MQTFREEYNERRLGKLEESFFNEWGHNLKIFGEILEALKDLQKIAKDLDHRVRRLEALVLFKEEDEEDS